MPPDASPTARSGLGLHRVGHHCSRRSYSATRRHSVSVAATPGAAGQTPQPPAPPPPRVLPRPTCRCSPSNSVQQRARQHEQHTHSVSGMLRQWHGNAACCCPCCSPQPAATHRLAHVQTAEEQRRYDQRYRQRQAHVRQAHRLQRRLVGCDGCDGARAAQQAGRVDRIAQPILLACVGASRCSSVQCSSGGSRSDVGGTQQASSAHHVCMPGCAAAHAVTMCACCCTYRTSNSRLHAYLLRPTSSMRRA